jgi:5-deoxy-glucuronate isomerase
VTTTEKDGLYLPAGSTADGVWDLVVTPESAGWGYSSLRVLTVAPGQVVEFATGDSEWIVLPLTGAVDVTLGDGTFALVGRENVFAGVTDTAYLPIDSTVTLTGTRSGQIALTGARADRGLPFRYQSAAGVDVSLRGTGSHTRQVNNFGMGAGMECVKLLATEVLTPASNWSSYPPHKHDEHVPGHESRLEEIYYFESAPARGGTGGTALSAFGLFHAYASPAGDISIDATVRTGDIALIPHGYHGPAVAAPGYDLYYLNVMAGPDPERVWLISDDPAHAWVRDSWAREGIDARLPLSDDESEER